MTGRFGTCPTATLPACHGGENGQQITVSKLMGLLGANLADAVLGELQDLVGEEALVLRKVGERQAAGRGERVGHGRHLEGLSYATKVLDRGSDPCIIRDCDAEPTRRAIRGPREARPVPAGGAGLILERGTRARAMDPLERFSSGFFLWLEEGEDE